MLPQPIATPSPYTTLFRSIPDLHRRKEVPEVHPSMCVHLEAVSLREMPQDAGHRPAEDLDLLVVQEEFTLVPAMGAELLAERSEEHTSELQSLRHLVCRLL